MNAFSNKSALIGSIYARCWQFDNYLPFGSEPKTGIFLQTFFIVPDLPFILFEWVSTSLAAEKELNEIPWMLFLKRIIIHSQDELKRLILTNHNLINTK
jgi:hypothetical protein